MRRAQEGESRTACTRSSERTTMHGWWNTTLLAVSVASYSIIKQKGFMLLPEIETRRQTDKQTHSRRYTTVR